MGSDFRKSGRDEMMRSKSVNAGVREIGRKEAEETRGFPILWMGMIEDVFQKEGKECKDQERLKTCKRNSIPERKRCCSKG